MPILVDLRPSGVTLDSGKDLWEDNEGAVRPEFVALATKIQVAARSLGLTADPPTSASSSSVSTRWTFPP